MSYQHLLHPFILQFILNLTFDDVDYLLDDVELFDDYSTIIKIQNALLSQNLNFIRNRLLLNHLIYHNYLWILSILYFISYLLYASIYRLDQVLLKTHPQTNSHLMYYLIFLYQVIIYYDLGHVILYHLNFEFQYTSPMSYPNLLLIQNFFLKFLLFQAYLVVKLQISHLLPFVTAREVNSV